MATKPPLDPNAAGYDEGAANMYKWQQEAGPDSFGEGAGSASGSGAPLGGISSLMGGDIASQVNPGYSQGGTKMPGYDAQGHDIASWGGSGAGTGPAPSQSSAGIGGTAPPIQFNAAGWGPNGEDIASVPQPASAPSAPHQLMGYGDTLAAPRSDDLLGGIASLMAPPMDSNALGYDEGAANMWKWQHPGS